MVFSSLSVGLKKTLPAHHCCSFYSESWLFWTVIVCLIHKSKDTCNTSTSIFFHFLLLNDLYKWLCCYVYMYVPWHFIKLILHLMSLSTIPGYLPCMAMQSTHTCVLNCCCQSQQKIRSRSYIKVKSAPAITDTV